MKRLPAETSVVLSHWPRRLRTLNTTFSVESRSTATFVATTLSTSSFIPTLTTSTEPTAPLT